MAEDPIKHVKLSETLSSGSTRDTEFGVVGGAIDHLKQEAGEDEPTVGAVSVTITRESGTTATEACDSRETAIDFLAKGRASDEEEDHDEDEKKTDPKVGDVCKLEDGSDGVIDESLACVSKPPEAKAGDACKLEDGSDGVLESQGEGDAATLVCVAPAA